MTIRAVLDESQFGELDESLKGLYEDQDGTYVLSVEDVDSHPQVQSLKSAMKNAKKERSDYQKQARGFKERFGPLVDMEDLDLSDVDPERVTKFMPYLTGEAEIPSGDGKDGDKKTPEELERIRQNARKPLERDLQSVTQERDSWKGLAEKTLIRGSLHDEFARAGVKDPDFLDLLVDRYSGKCRLEVDEDSAKVVIDSEYGEVNPKEFCKEWAGTDYAKKFIDASNSSGGGASGGASGQKLKNPWSPEHFSMTEQARVFKADPERAKRMAAEFGKSVGA